jgi:hypothetical protein
MITRRLSAALLGAVFVVSPHTPARACGGMVFPAHEQRVGGMSDQELFVFFGSEETVLVASAGYTGAPDEFAFILPLAQQPIAVQDGDTSLFIALDEFSAPRVAVFVDDGESGVGLCGGGLKDGGAQNGGGDFGQGDVMLHQRGSTATYEYVVIGGDTGTAVADWLADAGFTLPADYAAALDPYVEDGAFFFAARVAPDAGAGALKPLELHLPPAAPEAFEIPYGLAAHSLAPGQPLRLATYFFAGGPVLPANYEAQAVDPDELVARSESETNYADLERAILDEPDGAFVIDYSNPTDSSSLRVAFDDAVARGTDVAGADPTYIDGLFTRLNVTQAHLTRIRTELTAAQLGDLTLRRALGPAVNNSLSTTFDPDAASQQSCAIDRSGNFYQFLLLVPVLAWIRPRRRPT